MQESNLRSKIDKIKKSKPYSIAEEIITNIQKNFESKERITDMQNEATSNSQSVPNEQKLSVEQQLQEEIEQLPSELAKENYSQEQIIDVLKKYKGTLLSLENDDIEDFKNWSDLKRQLNLKNYLIQDGISAEIAENLSKIDYNGKLFEILGDEEQRKIFFEQLDIVIENPNHQKPVSDPEYQARVTEQRREVDLDASAAEASREQQKANEKTNNVQEEHTEQETQIQEIYSFIDRAYLEQDSVEGLIPRNGENSQDIQDSKKAVFYSQGKEGAIVMYFEFLKMYDENYEGKDNIYLRLGGIDTETDKKKAKQVDAGIAKNGNQMEYNYANSWTYNTIPPDRLEVMTLQGATSSDVRTSQKDIITYFLSQTSVDAIERLGVNDTTLENIRKYYQEHLEEIVRFGEMYSLVPRDMREFALESKAKKEQEQPTTISESTSTTSETSASSENQHQEVDKAPAETTEITQNMALVEQDNSFLGKIKHAMSKIKSTIKTKVSKFFGKDENTTEEEKTTSSEQVETASPKLHNTLDRYTIKNNHIEENAFKHFQDNGIVPKENENDKELGD